MEKNMKKKYTHTHTHTHTHKLSYFDIQQKLPQHCKSTIRQLKMFLRNSFSISSVYVITRGKSFSDSIKGLGEIYRRL